jgi:hypothetical protein
LLALTASAAPVTRREAADGTREERSGRRESDVTPFADWIRTRNEAGRVTVTERAGTAPAPTAADLLRSLDVDAVVNLKAARARDPEAEVFEEPTLFRLIAQALASEDLKTAGALADLAIDLHPASAVLLAQASRVAEAGGNPSGAIEAATACAGLHTENDWQAAAAIRQCQDRLQRLRISSPRRSTAAPAHEQSIQDINDRFVRQLSDQLSGRRQQPSGLVFKNIKLAWFKEVPAEQLLNIMNGGYAKALGVRCTFCHVAEDFASDEKRQKQAAREMAAMHWDLNRQLGAMRHLEGAPQDRFINCATCHRGQRDPHGTSR